MSDYPESLDTRPLTTWPGELTPSGRRVRSQFRSSIASTISMLDTELRAIRAKHSVLEVAIPAGQDNWRLSNRPRNGAKADHPGVVLSVTDSKAGALRFACDRYLTWHDNLHAIVLTMQALRAVERHGAVQRHEQYGGFAALPPGTGEASKGGLTREEATAELFKLSGGDWGIGPVDHEALYRLAVKRCHPDVGGSREDWDRLEQAKRVLEREGLL